MMTKAERRAQNSLLAATLASQCQRELPIPKVAHLVTPEDRWFHALMQGNTGDSWLHKRNRRRRYYAPGCPAPLPDGAKLPDRKPRKATKWDKLRDTPDRMPYEEPKGCGCTRCGCWKPFNVSTAVGGECHCPGRAPGLEPILDNLPHCEDCGALLPPPKHRGRKRGDLCLRCRHTANQATHRERKKLCPPPESISVTLPKSRATMLLEACGS
jgi:hypothetical protein